MEVPSGPKVLPFGVYAHNRAVVTLQYSVMPPEGILPSRLPSLENTSVRIQTSPEMGARFAQMLLELGQGGGTVGPRNDDMEHGLFMLEGQMLYQLAGDLHDVQAGDFIWMEPYCPQFCFCTGWGESSYLL